jgi:ADP-ribose pyrophosphatase YjhB (NUDIX family)
MNFCSHCGERVSRRIPDGDDRHRYVCSGCSRIHYQNPKIVVGTIPQWHGKILLCLRAIEPRYGMWTLPAGFLENDETVEAGAIRETREEAGIGVDLPVLFAVFDLTFVRQVYMMWRVDMISERVDPGAESLEAVLFDEADIPWDRLAFPVIRKTLECYFEDRRNGRFRLHTGRIPRGHRADLAATPPHQYGR